MPKPELQMADRLSLMRIIHNHSTYQQNDCPTGNDDQCVGEKLRPGVMLDVVPGPLKRGEDIDKKKRIHKHKYQKEDDIVLGDIVFRYIFMYHLYSKTSRQKYYFFHCSFMLIWNSSLYPRFCHSIVSFRPFLPFNRHISTFFLHKMSFFAA